MQKHEQLQKRRRRRRRNDVEDCRRPRRPRRCIHCMKMRSFWLPKADSSMMLVWQVNDMQIRCYSTEHLAAETEAAVTTMVRLMTMMILLLLILWNKFGIVLKESIRYYTEWGAHDKVDLL